jgi:nucleotide-binding universal stress UspA family protein
MSSEPIVVGTDGSVTADKAVDKAGELAAAFGATVHVVTCFSPMTTSAGLAAAGGMMHPLGEAEAGQAQAEETAKLAVKRLEHAGVKADRHVCAGPPADVLVSVASDVGAQMIVVGNKGMLGARRVLGSVPNRVAHHAACSVLIVSTC